MPTRQAILSHAQTEQRVSLHSLAGRDVLKGVDVI